MFHQQDDENKEQDAQRLKMQTPLYGAITPNERSPLLQSIKMNYTPPGRDAEVEHVPHTFTCGSLLMLFCICFLTFGGYWSYDLPGSIQTQLHDWFGPDYTKGKNAALYAVYSWPNVVLPLFSGYLIDNYLGVRAGSMVCSSLIVFGMMLFCYGVETKVYAIALAGRFVFGIGGESLSVAQNSFVVRWFQGPYLNFAFSIVLACARLGSAINFAVSPLLTLESVPFACWFAFAMCALSFGFNAILFVGDKLAEPRMERERAARVVALEVEKSEDAAHGMPVEAEDEREDDGVDEEVHPADMFRIGCRAWLMCGITVCFYISLFGMIQVASVILQMTGHKYSPAEASFFLMIPDVTALIITPLFGLLTGGSIRRNYALLCCACGLLVVVHVCFLLLSNGLVMFNVSGLMVLLGITYGLGSVCIWPTMATLVDSHMVSTAYGVQTSALNIALSVFPPIIGYFQDLPAIQSSWLEYSFPILFYIAGGLLGLLLTVVLLLGLPVVLFDEALAKEEELLHQVQDQTESKSSTSMSRHSVVTAPESISHRSDDSIKSERRQRKIQTVVEKYR